jgi:hypothetical protein
MSCGIEVDLINYLEARQGRLQVGIASIAIPFLLGFAAAWLRRRLLSATGSDPMIFALFLAIAISNHRTAHHCQNAYGHGPIPQRYRDWWSSAQQSSTILPAGSFRRCLGLMGNPAGSGHSIMRRLR